MAKRSKKQPKTQVDMKVDDMMNEGDEPSLYETDESNELQAEQATWKMRGDDRVPVSKSMGMIWRSRKETAVACLEDNSDLDRWNEAIRYYRNDHSQRGKKDSEDGKKGVFLTSRGMETENIVFANVTALVPAVYAKNPQAEITSQRPDLQNWCDVHEKLINSLLNKKSSPGINLKPKARRAVLMATLANHAYIELGYTKREESTEGHLAELQQLGEAYANAKDKQELKDIETKLQIIEDKIDLLRPSGPWSKFRKPHDILIDPDAKELDEARWIMIRDWLPTEFIRVMYGDRDEDGKIRSTYKPTHVLKAGAKSTDGVVDDIANFKMFNAGAEGEKTAKDYGYKDQDSYKKAQRTQVFYIWDKSTRRVFLYADNDWTWPLWVWNDPYEFPEFFPIEHLQFYIDPVEFYARSETMYYLDQQDGVNAVNNEIAKAREYIVGKVVYNSNVIKEEKVVDDFIAGTTSKRALGINVPPDVDINKLFAPFTPQSVGALNTVIFDKERLIQAIDRVSSVTNVMRGVEYKTNTTNKAIESYESTTQTRLDEKIDTIEDFVGGIATKLGHLCVKFMTDEEVIALIGEERAQLWIQDKPTIQELGAYFAVNIEGGSTLKPTSPVKKQQAISVSQAMGQFAQAAPAAVIVMLRVLERAFDEVVVTKEDWQFIQQSIEQQLQRGNSEGGEGGGSGDERLAKIEQIVDQLPPEAKGMLGQAIAKGMPVKQAIAAVIQKVQSAAQQQQEPQANPQGE